jgi:poly(A) polymerase
MDTKEIATKIVQKLVNEGYTAYFAGGWVRDYLLRHPSDDIDIATNADPETVVALFPKTIEVGIAFGVVIVHENGRAFEVATFRKDLDYKDGRKPTGIEPSTPEEDAKRRDFTINGMFYDPLTDRILDFVGGKEDLQRGMIRTIGDPYERFFEDRLRMIRAVRFACRFSFHIDPETENAIAQNADSLFPAVSVERIWQEFNKMAAYPSFDWALIEMHRLGLLQAIFPRLGGTHLNDIKKRVAPFHKMPPGTPTIAYLLQLFPDIEADEIKDLCRTLKTSNRDLKFAEFFHGLQHLDKPDLHDWSHIYAHPDSELCIKILSAKQESPEVFLKEHERRKKGLLPHINRIIEKTPVVTSQDLIREGIKPGKHMGKLLSHAERIAIQDELHTPEEVIQNLKKTKLWEEAHD